MKTLKLAIAGVGNCASSLVEGLEYYKDCSATSAGLMHPEIGGYRLENVKVVAAFDVDRARSVSPEEAMFADPNNTRIFQQELPRSGVTVPMGPVHDGVPAHMANYPDAQAFRVAESKAGGCREGPQGHGRRSPRLLPAGGLRDGDSPLGYAQACLDAGVGMVNNIPVFIASDPVWAEHFKKKNLPIIGDNIKSAGGSHHRASDPH